MIIWIEKPLAIAIHERQLAEHGGGIGVRDENLLDSALAHPQQAHAYGDPPPDLADPAAGLAFGLARNHPFVDGNKRTAAVACKPSSYSMTEHSTLMTSYCIPSISPSPKTACPKPSSPHGCASTSRLIPANG